jgi:7-alpha-hydroxysteroid dehydrogenase
VDQFMLTDRVALITGAGKGIGAAIARSFAEAGADVAIMARTKDDLEAVAGDVRARGRRALVYPADVSQVERLPELVAATVEMFGRLDIVVNNAGGSISHPFLDTRVEHLEAAFRFNVSVPFELSRLAVPHLLEQEGSSIVNISSVAGRNAVRANVAYGTAKAAFSHMTRLMAADLAPRIRVNAILPGAVETDALRKFLDRIGPDVRQTMFERTRMRRNGMAEDIANAALYLASPAAGWVTGKLLEVDGMAAEELIPKDVPDL